MHLTFDHTNFDPKVISIPLHIQIQPISKFYETKKDLKFLVKTSK